MKFRKGMAGLLAAVMATTTLLSALIIPASVSVAEEVVNPAPAGYVSVTDDFSDIAKAIDEETYTLEGAALKKDGENVKTIVTKSGFKYEDLENGVFRFRSYEGYDNNLYTNWGEHVKISLNNGGAFNLKNWVLTRNEWSDSSANEVTIKGYDYVDGTEENDVELYSKVVTLESKTNEVQMNWNGVEYIVCTVGQGVGFCDVNYEVPDSALLAYEGFETLDGKDNVALSEAKTTGFGWADEFSAADAQWKTKGNFGIFSGSGMDYAFGDEEKIVKRDANYLVGGRNYVNIRRQLAVPSGGDYTKATTYYTKSGNEIVPNNINAYGKPGTTLYFSGLINDFMGDDDDRWISFDRGAYEGWKNNGNDGYIGNDHIALGMARGQNSSSLCLRYMTKDAENAGKYKVEIAYPETAYSLHTVLPATFFVVKFEFGTDGNTKVSLYLDPSSAEPQTPSATITATTDVSFDRIYVNANGTNKTALDELKLATSWAAAVDAVDGSIPAELNAVTESKEDVLLIEEKFDSYEKGNLIRPIAEAANQVKGGGFGWANGEPSGNNSQNFTWSSTQKNDSNWADQIKVDDVDPLEYPNLVTSGKYITKSGTDTVGFGRLMDVSNEGLAAVNGYVNTDASEIKYLGTPGKSLWMSAMMRMQTKGANEGNVITLDRGRWGFPWQADGPGLNIGVRRWSGDDKNYWNVAFGATKVKTEKEIVAGEDTLIVAKIDRNEAIGGTISVWINPDLNTLGTPDAKLDVRNQGVFFRQLTITNRDYDLGAFRLGTTMASVLPLKSYKVPVTGFEVDAEGDKSGLAILGTSFGKDGPYEEIDAEKPVDYKYIKITGKVGEAGIETLADKITLLAGDRKIDMSQFAAENIDTSSADTVIFTMDADAPDKLLSVISETGAGQFEYPQYKTLKFSNNNENAKLYYTLDESEPEVGAESTYEYDANTGISIAPGKELTVKIKAVAEGYEDSDVSTYIFNSPADDFEDGFVDNGSFQVKEDDGKIYGWTLWGVDGSKDELVVVPSSGGANETEAAKIPVDYAGKTVEISAKVKVEGDLEAANDANMMIKIHAKGDENANFEPAAEAGKMFLLTKTTEGISTEEYVEIKQTVKLPETAEFEDFANPYFRVEIWNNSDLTWHIDDLTVKSKAAAPVANIDAVTDSDEPLSIELTAEEGAKIYYTVDGSEPTVESAEYAEAIAVNYGESIELKAIAVIDGYIASDLFSANYSVLAKADAPVIAPTAGTYDVEFGKKQEVTITAEEGAKIYYTLDGTDPTAESTEYTAAIQLDKGTTTIKAIAVVEGKVNSDIAEAIFVVNELPEPTPTPTATPITSESPKPGVSESPSTTPEVTPTPEVAKKVKKVKLAKKKIKIKKGKKFTIKVKLTPKKLTKAAKKVKWSIDKKGKKVVKFVKKAKKLKGKLKVKVKALKKGKAKITCKAPSGKKAVCKITVK